MIPMLDVSLNDLESSFHLFFFYGSGSDTGT